MSRSRYYPGRRPRRTDVWVRWARQDHLAKVVIVGEAEYQDHVRETDDDGDPDYHSDRARVLMLWDSKSTHHRGRRRTQLRRGDDRQRRRRQLYAMRYYECLRQGLSPAQATERAMGWDRNPPVRQLDWAAAIEEAIQDNEE